MTRSSTVYDSKKFVNSRDIEVTEVDQKADVPVAGYRIFNGLGGLKVIAVPFIEGSHQPQNKAQLLGVAKFLKKMHDQGFVHGDVRLLNIVFTDEASDCQLIDFDFGGRSDDPLLVYPPGYKEMLGDGKRIGSAGDRILKWHDVYAIYYAFDQVLVGKSIEWQRLKTSGMIELSIDKLIEVMGAMVSCDDCIIAIPPELIITLEKNNQTGNKIAEPDLVKYQVAEASMPR
jgi:serine/threonine protein kinase